VKCWFEKRNVVQKSDLSVVPLSIGCNRRIVMDMMMLPDMQMHSAMLVADSIFVAVEHNHERHKMAAVKWRPCS